MRVPIVILFLICAAVFLAVGFIWGARLTFETMTSVSGAPTYSWRGDI